MYFRDIKNHTMKQIKFSSLLITLFLLPIQLFAQDELVDEGISPVFINAHIESLKANLTKVNASDLWLIDSQDPESKNNLDVYTYNVKGLESNAFFGLPVERIEVKSNWCYNESTDIEGGEGEEFIGVREFYLFIKLPNQKEFDNFSTKIEEKYGPIRSYEINMDDDSETPMWFSFMTMMTFTNYDAPFVSENGEKYILVKYRCAHGG